MLTPNDTLTVNFADDTAILATHEYIRGEIGIFPSPRAYIEGGGIGFFLSPRNNEENMKKYEGNMKKSEENMKKYKGNMRKYKGM